MKKFLVLILLLLNIVVYSQTIITNTVSLKNNPTVLSQINIFHVKKDVIFWQTPDDKIITYHIVKSTKLSDLEYIIYCITEGKVAIFNVKFAYHTINIDDLMFYNVDRL